MPDNPLRQKAQRVYDALAAKYPEARIELNYNNPLELLVATLLSAQCTDKKVNQVTAELFAKYHTPQDYLRVPADELEADIHPTGFFRQKAKSLRAIMQRLIDQFNGQVPQAMEQLTALPGIGRKTANVIRGNAFQQPGIAVDTHVKRISNRIGLSARTDPDKIEQNLMQLYPEKLWISINHIFIFHGRYTCISRKPKCEQCPITADCDFFQAQKSS